MQKTLFSVTKKDILSIPSFENWRRVTTEDKHIFDELFSQKDQLLYDQSDISPFAYWNIGNFSLYINQDWTSDRIIPIVKKFSNKPRYYLYSPNCEADELFDLMTKLQPYSNKPVGIFQVTKSEADTLKSDGRFRAVKTSGDYINNIPEQVELKGKKFKSVRRRIFHAERENSHIEFSLLTPKLVDKTVEFFGEWNATQGKKYLRGAVGRDIRLIQMYNNHDDKFNFCMIGYDTEKDKVASCYFVNISQFNPKLSTCVTAKALTEYPDLGYLTYFKAKQESFNRGVEIENISGTYSKGVKEQKERWRPFDIYNSYDVFLKENK